VTYDVTGSRASAEQFGLKHELLGASQLRVRFPAVRAHLDLAARAGAELHSEEPVTHWEDGRVSAPETIDHTVHAHEVAAATRPVMPGLVGRTNTAHDHVTVACGFSGHGFKFVPIVGEILADLTIDGATRHPIALFDPARLRGAA
jgi:glycine/D-amino acid oxidase-like deaminating enzyme